MKKDVLFEFINEIWINELVEQEDGGFRASSGMRWSRYQRLIGYESPQSRH